MEPTAVKLLRTHLNTLASGPCDSETVLPLLKGAWHDLPGGDETKMEAYKLDRAKGLFWKPPHLEFRIERHGTEVLGSTRSEIQSWQVDLATGTASIVGRRRHQARPMDARFDVRAEAADLAAAIKNAGRGQAADPRFTISGNTLKLHIADIVPLTNATTTASRRKRFAGAIYPILQELGWEPMNSKRRSWTFRSNDR